jgi:hypothetical protein
MPVTLTAHEAVQAGLLISKGRVNDRYRTQWPCRPSANALNPTEGASRRERCSPFAQWGHPLSKELALERDCLTRSRELEPGDLQLSNPFVDL